MLRAAFADDANGCAEVGLFSFAGAYLLDDGNSERMPLADDARVRGALDAL